MAFVVTEMPVVRARISGSRARNKAHSPRQTAQPEQCRESRRPDDLGGGQAGMVGTADGSGGKWHDLSMIRLADDVKRWFLVGFRLSGAVLFKYFRYWPAVTQSDCCGLCHFCCSRRDNRRSRHGTLASIPTTLGRRPPRSRSGARHVDGNVVMRDAFIPSVQHPAGAVLDEGVLVVLPGKAANRVQAGEDRYLRRDVQTTQYPSAGHPLPAPAFAGFNQNRLVVNTLLF
jgi:hypothetical protein